MVSPFPDFMQNAELTVSITGELTQDLATGEWVSSNTATATYKAFLKQKKDPQVNYSEGVDRNESYYEGYLIEPQQLPDGITAPSKIKCKIRETSGRELEGMFEFRFVASRVSLADAVLGQKIEGYFIHD